MSNDTYNGWTNYPTWAVNLWLSNDEGLYDETSYRARDASSHAPEDENVENGIWTVAQTAKFRLAESLKDWVSDELAPDLGATFAADLLGWALAHVDWDEIAEAWLSDVAETAS